jgi:hypothetical protein
MPSLGNQVGCCWPVDAKLMLSFMFAMSTEVTEVCSSQQEYKLPCRHTAVQSKRPGPYSHDFDSRPWSLSTDLEKSALADGLAPQPSNPALIDAVWFLASLVLLKFM